MKFIALLAFSVTTSVFACSQAPALISQTGNLHRVLDSESFRAEISKNMGSDYSTMIKLITFGNTVKVKLTNDCAIESSLKFEAPSHDGMCPRFVGVTSVTVCK